MRPPIPLLPARPPLLDRLRLWRDLRRLLRRVDRPALNRLRRRCRERWPGAVDSKYWQLERQLAKNLRRAYRLGLHRAPCLFYEPAGERPWGAAEWRFFLADLAERVLAPEGRVLLSLNRTRQGRYLDPEVEQLFRSVGGEIDGRDVYFPGLVARIAGVIAAPGAG